MQYNDCHATCYLYQTRNKNRFISLNNFNPSILSSLSQIFGFGFQLFSNSCIDDSDHDSDEAPMLVESSQNDEDEWETEDEMEVVKFGNFLEKIWIFD